MRGAREWCRNSYFTPPSPKLSQIPETPAHIQNRKPNTGLGGRQWKRDPFNCASVSFFFSLLSFCLFLSLCLFSDLAYFHDFTKHKTVCRAFPQETKMFSGVKLVPFSLCMSIFQRIWPGCHMLFPKGRISPIWTGQKKANWTHLFLLRGGLYWICEQQLYINIIF